MMTLRTRIFIGMSIVVLGIFAIALMLTRISSAPDDTGTEPIFPDAGKQSENQSGGSIIPEPRQLSAVLADEDEGERYVRQFAIDFVERFGSFSNQERNIHITDVLPLVTDSMAAWVRTQEQSYSDTYHGSTTRVIVSRVDVLSETEATVHIEAQQVLESQSDVKRLYHVGRVTLVRVGADWKVSGLYWDT